MNLLPIGQADTFVEEDLLFAQPMVQGDGLEVEEDVPPPPTEVPAFYLHRFYSDTKATWEMLTGLDFSTSTPEEIADAFRRVVKKHVEKPGTQRDAFSAWGGHKVATPTGQEQASAEKQVQSGNANIIVGSIIEGVSPEDRQVPMMHVDYYVLVDPASVRAASDIEEPSGVGLSNRTKVAGVAGLIVGGVATSLLVKKGTGLKLLAGVAGGVIMAGVLMRASHSLEQGEVA